MAIRAVFFDIGETLVDETRQWSSWADWLAIPRLTFFAALGAAIESGGHHRRVFDYFFPDFDFAKAVADRAAAGYKDVIVPTDFYPDALPALSALKRAGYLVGIAGNQPKETEAALLASGIEADIIASSARWGVEKPFREFFLQIIQAAGCQPSEIAYVGDRLDNDIGPAREAGLHAIFLVRGPWGVIHAQRSDMTAASAVIHGLDELPEVLGILT